MAELVTCRQTPPILGVANAPDRPTTSSEHHLQLFDSSRSLAETVCGFLMAGFERGEAMLVVATPQHRELLDAHDSKRPASTFARPRAPIAW